MSGWQLFAFIMVAVMALLLVTVGYLTAKIFPLWRCLSAPGMVALIDGASALGALAVGERQFAMILLTVGSILSLSQVSGIFLRRAVVSYQNLRGLW